MNRTTDQCMDEQRREALQQHPSNTPTATSDAIDSRDEDGSLVSEYGLLAMVAAVLCAGLMTVGRTYIGQFFSALLDAARNTVIG